MKRIALIGAESTGKSTLALMLTGRLRTYGVRAALVAESGSELPFDPKLFDTRYEAHQYAVASKMAAEAKASLRPNVDFLISDRSPFDHAMYWKVRDWGDEMHGMEALYNAAFAWCRQYDAMYMLDTDGAEYVEDGYREVEGKNFFRKKVADNLRWSHGYLDAIGTAVYEVKGTFRERSEWVFHHVMNKFLGRSRPLRVYEQVKQWLTERGWGVLDIRPQGSESITRFHPASDHDDVDAIVEVDGAANYAIAVRADIEKHRVHLENICQCNLDLLVTPKGMKAYEA